MPNIVAYVIAGAVSLAAFVLLPLNDAIVSIPLLWALMQLSVIDLRTYTLPDFLTLPLLCAGLVVSAAGLGPSLIASTLGALFGYGSLALIAACYRRLRGRDGLGLGDAKLLAALGAWTGVESLPYILLAASLLGLMCYGAASVRSMPLVKSEVIPFGPFLSISGASVFVATRSPLIATDLFQAFMQLP